MALLSGAALYVGYVLLFTVAALACFGGLAPARRVDDPETRRGLRALLALSGAWALLHVGYLVAPTVALQYWLYVAGLVVGFATVGPWLYFCSAYTGRSLHRNRAVRTTAVTVYLSVVAVKLTNPLHGLYFEAHPATAPFAYLAIEHEPLHWIVMGLAYSLAFIGIFMLFELFTQVDYDTRPLLVVVGLTGLPVVLDVLAATTSLLITITYSSLGVAAFAVGVAWVYLEEFQTVQLTSDHDEPAIVVGTEGRVRNVNDAAESLHPALAEATGEALADAFPAVAEALEADDDVVALERDGETRFYQVTDSPFSASQTNLGRVVSLTDVTERETYRQELERKTEQLEALNRVVRHDIRNDMAVVQGWAQTLEDHVDEAGQDALDRVLRKSEQVVELTETVRDFVDVLVGTGDLERKPMAVDEYLRTEVEAAREAYPNAEFRIEGDLPSASAMANEMLTSVFRNLLNNAVQHSDRDVPTVTVTGEVDEGTVRVRIADDGPGVPDDRKDEIFGKTEKGLESSGSGIGLYLVNTIVSEFGGRVRVEDNDPRGAVFVVELPLARDAEEENGFGETTPVASMTDGRDANPDVG